MVGDVVIGWLWWEGGHPQIPVQELKHKGHHLQPQQQTGPDTDSY